VVPERVFEAVREPLTLRVKEPLCEAVALGDALPDGVALPERDSEVEGVSEGVTVGVLPADRLPV
jgi:hypothetical protein